MRDLPWFSISRFFLYITPLALVIVTASTLFPFIVGKYVWFRTSVALALIFFLIGVLFESEEGEEYLRKIGRILKTPLGIAVTAFTAIFIIAGIFGLRPGYSFWSNFERGEGGLQMLNLYIFFILLITLLRKESEWRKLFWVVLWTALLMILYGLGAGLGYNGFIGAEFGKDFSRFYGSLGNPAYMAGFLIFSSFYAVYILTTRYRKHLFSHPGAVFIWLLLGIYAVIFLLAATRGAFLGIIGGAFLGLGYVGFVKRSWRKWAITIIIFLAITAGTLIAFKNSEFVKKIPGSRIFDISLSTTTFQHRTIMWKVALDSWKERPILGWGPESFGVLFQKNFNPDYFDPKGSFGAWFDRAHNILFDYLVSTGILGTLAYMAIFATIYWKIFRRKIEEQTGLSSGIAALALAMPTAYLVQGLVLFDVLSIYLNLFIFFAFAWFLFYFKDEYESLT